MGYYVHLQVSWGGGDKDIVASIAARHLPLIKQEEETSHEAEWFLKCVISGQSYFGGTKGDFWSWGIIGNYSRAEEFIEFTKPFFMELFENGCLHEHDRVIFMCEPEQSESVSIYQLDSAGELKEFSSNGAWYWGQY